MIWKCGWVYLHRPKASEKKKFSGPTLDPLNQNLTGWGWGWGWSKKLCFSKYFW